MHTTNNKLFGVQCEKAIRFLCEHMPSAEKLRKPTVFHDIRVGVYLYENHYKNDIVIAGILHDILEDGARVHEDVLQKEFGNMVTKLVKASTKDDSMTDPEEKILDKIGESTYHQKNTLYKGVLSVGDTGFTLKGINFEYYLHAQ